MSLEGTSIGSDEDGLAQPTLVLDPLNGLKRLARGYLERYLDSGRRQGEIAALWGAHGAGKTHAIRFVMEQVKEKASDSPQGAPGLFQAYAKAEGPDFVALYRTMMGGIPLELLRDLSLRFLGVVASDQFGQDLDNREAAIHAANKLRREPDQVYNLFRRYLVEEGAVQAQQSKEVEQIAGGMDDFQRALSYLLSPELCSAANDWLVGRPVKEDDTRKLGVSGPISSADVAKLGLQLLASLLRRVGKPFVFYIDQFEKLVLAGDDVLARQNTGLLHSLVEIVPRENGMLVLSGNEAAWQTLPQDLKQRFAGNALLFPVLSLKESTELLSVYLEFSLKDGSEASSFGLSEEDLYPFTSAAVREIVRNSGGNIRRILQIASAAFDAAAPQRQMIDKDLVRSALTEKGWDVCNEAAVIGEIEKVLSDLPVRFERERRIGDLRVAFAIFDESGSIVIVIELSQAIFYNDEARKALRNIKLVEELRRLARPPVVMLIVLGYISPEVSAEVSVAVSDMIVYEPESFRATLTARVGQHLRNMTERPSDKGDEYLLRDQLAEVKAALEQMLATREDEVQRLESRLADLLQKQSVDRLSERSEATRHAWIDERQRIEEKIRAVRTQRRMQEVDELEQLRAKAELEKQRRTVFAGLIVGVALLGLCLQALGILFRPFTWSALIALIVSACAGVGTYFLLVWRVLEPREARDLAGNVTSLQELDRLAVSFVTSRRTKARPLLLSSNPHLRYAGALLVNRSDRYGEVVHILHRERSAIIRRKLIERAARTGEMRIEDVSDLPEVPYAVEALAGMVPPDTFDKLPSRMKSLAALSGARNVGGSSLVVAITESRPNFSPLLKAFLNGITDDLAADIGSIAESALRTELEDLTPFEDGGLGTFDELKNIRIIDEHFLFFRQLLFFRERRVL